MEQMAARILDAHRIMAISTVRPDGWPQTTIVGYANVGVLIYFLVSRSSQKFANIEKDDRISIAVGNEPDDLREIKAVYAGARASEVTDPKQREQAWELLMLRHPNLAEFELPDPSKAAMMRASCKYISILDFSKGVGHSDSLTVSGPGLASMDAASDDDWGYLPKVPDNWDVTPA
jgi:nitroimidazol reductase NimA-like FMN-containing flavoprotein (pyridoxamine 5'-phosphate oxidase superfamily)